MRSSAQATDSRHAARRSASLRHAMQTEIGDGPALTSAMWEWGNQTWPAQAVVGRG